MTCENVRMKKAVSHDSAVVKFNILFNNLLEFVLYIADDLTVEEVDDALSTGCVFL